MKTKVPDKSTRLIAVLLNHVGKNMNLARIKFFGMFVCALCKVQTVGFDKLATAFECGSKSESSLRRIQRFMSDYKLNTDLIAQLIFKLLPHKPPFRLALDRTQLEVWRKQCQHSDFSHCPSRCRFPNSL
ncbi:hypothetical protein EZS27_002440 [termite gut metagenome]|uniref:Transposase IS701-like DDE domain-containing protein n=1 Tax=termite gut metagenome TaxID=433724 RepID=A0A5J4SVR4_9ZZZZ